MPFSEFRRSIDNGDLVKSEPVTITTTTISGVVRTADGDETDVATIPPGYVPTDLVDDLSARGMRSTASSRTR